MGKAINSSAIHLTEARAETRGEKTASKHKEADDQRAKARGSLLKNRLQVRRTRKERGRGEREREEATVDVRKREVKW